jgi:hypothetical protein
MSTDIAQPQPRAPRGSPIGRSDRGKVTGRLKTALELVVNEGLDPYEAATKVGLHRRTMRLALNKRHVLTHLRAAREVLRTTASAQNIHYAIAMRAGSTNEMARLGAMKFIEGNDEETQQRRGSISSPGLVIQIVQSPVPRVPVTTEPIVDLKPAPVPASRQLFVPGRDEPINEDATVFRSPWDRPR